MILILSLNLKSRDLKKKYERMAIWRIEREREEQRDESEKLRAREGQNRKRGKNRI